MTQYWHTESVEEVLTSLEVGLRGLQADEVRRRLAAHGPNRIPAPPRPSAWRRFLAQFQNILIYVLLGAASVTALLAHWVDTAVILAVVIINALIGYV